MSKIRLYIATTLDGYIARENGNLDWLMSFPNPNKIDYGYQAFYNEISTVIMGRSTYEEILGFDVEWPYSDCKTYVISSRSDFSTSTENTEVLSDLSIENLQKIKNAASKDVWLVGGGKVISEFLNLGVVDEMLLTLIPVILGKGISLFPNQPKETNFTLQSAQTFETGVVNLTYIKK